MARVLRSSQSCPARLDQLAMSRQRSNCVARGMSTNVLWHTHACVFCYSAFRHMCQPLPAFLTPTAHALDAWLPQVSGCVYELAEQQHAVHLMSSIQNC